MKRVTAVLEANALVSSPLVGLIALVGVLVARRDRRHDLGSVSGSWIAHHRATDGRVRRGARIRTLLTFRPQSRAPRYGRAGHSPKPPGSRARQTRLGSPTTVESPWGFTHPEVGPGHEVFERSSVSGIRSTLLSGRVPSVEYAKSGLMLAVCTQPT